MIKYTEVLKTATKKRYKTPLKFKSDRKFIFTVETALNKLFETNINAAVYLLQT